MTNPKQLRRTPGAPTQEFRERGNVTVEGVSKSGEISDKGTVTHRERWTGEIDATVRPKVVKVEAKRDR